MTFDGQVSASNAIHYFDTQALNDLTVKWIRTHDLGTVLATSQVPPFCKLLHCCCGLEVKLTDLNKL